MLRMNIIQICVDSPLACKIKYYSNQKDNIDGSKRVEFCEKGWGL